MPPPLVVVAPSSDFYQYYIAYLHKRVGGIAAVMTSMVVRSRASAADNHAEVRDSSEEQECRYTNFARDKQRGKKGEEEARQVRLGIGSSSHPITGQKIPIHARLERGLLQACTSTIGCQWRTPDKEFLVKATPSFLEKGRSSRA